MVLAPALPLPSTLPKLEIDRSPARFTDVFTPGPLLPFSPQTLYQRYQKGSFWPPLCNRKSLSPAVEEWRQNGSCVLPPPSPTFSGVPASTQMPPMMYKGPSNMVLQCPIARFGLPNAQVTNIQIHLRNPAYMTPMTRSEGTDI